MADSPDQLLFSYGTLQQPEVQLDTFGRIVVTDDDVLAGYTVDYAEIDDPRSADPPCPSVQPVVRSTGNALDKIPGTVLHLTEEELDAADEYQLELYLRAQVQLASGRSAWVYVTV